MNAMYFRRANKVLVENYDENSNINFAEVAALDANLRVLGYTLDGTLAQRLLNAPVDEIKRIHDTLISEAKEIKGVRSYRAMYPNFPKQVMEASSAELYVNAIVHYWSGGTLLPVYNKIERPDLDFNEDKYTVISLGDGEDLHKLIVNLFKANSAWSETDKADVKSLPDPWFSHAYNVAYTMFENRENKAVLGAESLRRGFYINHKMDTATDVLRLAVAMSDGDVSLAEKTVFRSFTRNERRHIMFMLDCIKGDITEDMLRHAAAWKRLGERIHPGEFKNYPFVQEAFSVVRNNGSVETFNSKVEKALADKDPLGAARLLKSRPGEFARRLDHVLRTNAPVGVQQTIIRKFAAVADKVSPTVLLQTRNAFINRGNDQRVFFPKGSVAKMQVVDDKRESLSKDIRQAVVVACDAGLAKQFGERDSLGGTYVDPALKGIAVPFGMRNASKALKTLGRGSRLSLGDDTNVVRFFIWWKNAESSWGTDIDLSAVCLDDKFRNVFDITYYNLRRQGAVHSGDITNAPNGASEFIDIDIDRLKSQGVRYVAMTLYSYSGHGFVELPECFAGFMERSDLDSGEIYDPRTVTNKVDLASDAKSATPFIFDLATGEAIWVDLSVKVHGAFANAYNSREVTKTIAQAMVELTPPNLYDLFTAHARARGGMVSKDKAKTVFSFDGDVTPFDSEEILANYL